MKLLFSSRDAGAVGSLVKQLVVARIPCAVSKDPVNACQHVWVQQDIDFGCALHLLMHRSELHPVPPWASVLDPNLSPIRGHGTLLTNGTEAGSLQASRLAAEMRWGLTNSPLPEDYPGRKSSPTAGRSATFGRSVCAVLPSRTLRRPPNPFWDALVDSVPRVDSFARPDKGAARLAALRAKRPKTVERAGESPQRVQSEALTDLGELAMVTGGPYLG